MRTFCLLTGLTAGLALCGVLMAAPIIADGMPEVLHSQGPGSNWPVWVAASRAVDGEGRFDSELIHPATLAYYEKLLAESPAVKSGGCVDIKRQHRGQPWEGPGVAEIVQAAEMAFLGRVTGVAYGFGLREPGQLVQIKPEQVFHGDVQLPSYYVFVPAGRFKAGPFEFCKEAAWSFRDHGAPYKVGDELLVMPRKSRLRSPEDPFLSLQDGRGLVRVREYGPPVYTALHAHSKANWAHVTNRADLVAGLAEIASSMAPSETSPEAKGGAPFPERLVMAQPHPEFRWVWHRADTVFDAHGEFLDGGVDDWVREYLGPDLNNRELFDDSGCIDSGGLVDDQQERADRLSISGAAKGSAAVMLGEVEGRAFGFYKAQPGQLVRFRPTTTFKGAVELEAYYFFLPVGEFAAGPYRFCKTDYRYPEPPVPGEEVLVMVPDQYNWNPKDPFVRLETADSLVIISSEGRVRRTSLYADSPQRKKEGSIGSKPKLLAAVLKATKAGEN